MVKRLFIFSKIIALLTISIESHGQYLKYKFDRISVKDGLAQASVNHIIQDSSGFMWFATYNGLSRYDGYNFKNIQHNPDNPNSLCSNATSFVLEDSKGTLWVINSNKGGIDTYDPVANIFTNHRHNPDDTNSLSSNNVYHITQDSQGDLWISTENAVNKVTYENGLISFKHYTYPDGGHTFPYVYENQKQNLFLFSETTNYLLDRETSSLVPLNDTLLRIYYYCSIIEDEEGYLYTIHDQNLVKLKYNPQSLAFDIVKRYATKIPVNKKNSLIFDIENNIWIGNEGNGLFKLNISNEYLEHFLYDEMDDFSISDNSINSLFVDATGVLWIGTVNEGICKFDLFRKKFFHYKSIKGNPASLSGNLITAIHSKSDREIWVGTDSDYGINRLIFDGTRLVQVFRYGHDPENENSLATNKVTCLVQRKNGDVWVGGKTTTLTRIIPDDQYYGEGPRFERHGVSGWTFSIFEDSNGNLWGGTWGAGLFRYNDLNNKFTYYKNIPNDNYSLCDDVVWSIYEDSNKNLWIGGNSKGISILPASQKDSEHPIFINLSYEKDNPNSLSSNTINGFMQDSKGNMWIATSGGLNLVKNSKKAIDQIETSHSLDFIAFKTEDGLSGDGIVGIAEDLSKNIWVSSTNGISFLNLKDSTITNYYESDGLQSDEFVRNSHLVNSKGIVFFAGKNGINAFDPSEIKANPHTPKIAFTDLKISNKSVMVGEKIDKKLILPIEFNNMDEVVFCHKHNVFSIDFAALHYNKPEQNQFAYYLEGFEENWNFVEDVRSTTYTNLDPGKYIFHVKASNNNGVWNKEGKSITIRVKAAWHNTWVFRGLLLVVIGLAIAYAVRRRMENIKHEKIFLQKKIQEGEQALQIKKDEIEKQKQEIEEQNRRDFELRYLQTGISNFAELIASNRQDLSKLTEKLISELVNYTETNSGVVYLVEDSDSGNIRLIRSGAFCYDTDTHKEHDLIPGEGYVGTCYLEKKRMLINDLPEGYISLTSALGKTSLKHSVLTPIVHEDICFGVIELGSMAAIEKYKTEFVSKLAENYASVIAINKANISTQKMLEQNRVQAEELKFQEEELRQNLEEMQATQEELRRQMEDSEKAKDKMLFEQTLSDAFLNNAPEKIYFKDLDSCFLKASNSMKELFKADKVEDIYGKTDFDFFTEEHARPAFEDEQNIIKTGNPIIDKIEKETHTDGRVTYVTTTKLPLKNSKGEIIGTFGISKDITEIMKLKETVDKREEEMFDKEEQINELHKLIEQKEKEIKELEKKLK